MAVEISIKKEFKKTKVAFGKSAKPLGSRDDLMELALIARRSNHKSLINYFEKLPSLEELESYKVEQFLEKENVIEEEVKKEPVVIEEGIKEENHSEKKKQSSKK